MDKKQLNVKDILINNGIVILILLMVLFVGVTKQNFFSRSNFSNISINMPFHHRSRRIRLSDYERYRPFCRTSGWTFCLPGRYSAPEE